MDGGVTGLVAVTLFFMAPIGLMYTYYRVRQLRTQERLAAIARGVDIPMEPEVSQVARSRRMGILLVFGAIGYIATFAIIARISVEPDMWAAAAFGVIPLAVGIGYFVDWIWLRAAAHS